MRRRLSSVASLLLLSDPALGSGPTSRIHVTFEGAPLKGLHVTFSDVYMGQVRVVTDEDGTADLLVPEPPHSIFLETDCGDSWSCDHSLTDCRVEGTDVHCVAVHNVRWAWRVNPRVCDELTRTHDIVRGHLAGMPASAYDRWYASLSDAALERCRTLDRLERAVGSKAPWYFYAFKGQAQTCTESGLEREIDWAAWYRGLLSEATGHDPGPCKSDWERWWQQRGYEPVPDPLSVGPGGPFVE